MSDRDTILQKIRGALEPLPERTAYPEWDDQITVCKGAGVGDPVEQFQARFEAAKGILFPSVETLRAYMDAEGYTRGFVQSDLMELLAGSFNGLDLTSEVERACIDDYAFGISRASGGIAESGTLILRDADCPYRLGALAPWFHVAVLRKSDICPTIAEAIANLGTDPSIIFVTGPSKTADIEGILIQGVHGPGIQGVLLV